jgi:hypothetical protein
VRFTCTTPRNWNNGERLLALSAADFEGVNPNTGGAPVFRTKRDAEITTEIYRRQPVLVDRHPEREGKPAKNVWPVRYATMFHMTNDSRLFMRRDELDSQGWYPVEHHMYKKGEAIALPLYEGKMVQMYDHRAANVVVDPSNIHRPAQPQPTTLSHHQDPKFYAQPQFWVVKSQVDTQFQGDWVIGFKDVTAPTNVRTMIAAVLPQAGFGNTVPILAVTANTNQSFEPLLLANLNSS